MESLFSKHLFQNQFQLKILGKEKLLRATCNGYLIAAIDIFNLSLISRHYIRFLEVIFELFSLLIKDP